MILYTGATGSIGSDMPPEAIALKTRLEASVSEMKNEIQSYVQSPFSFIHLAGLVSVAECEKNPERARELNVGGALKWFDAACESGARVFVYVSTAHVYAPSSQPLTIHSAVAPRSTYAKTKLEAETVLRAEAKKFPSIKLSIARVFSVIPRVLRHGFLVTALHDRAVKGDFSPIPGLDNVRDFLEAKEICNRLVKLAGLQNPPEFVHICSGQGTKIRTLAEKVFEKYHSGFELQAAPGRPDDIPYMVGVPSKIEV